MKLITKLTVWYIFFTTIVLAIGGVIIFREVLNDVDHEAHRKLNSWIVETERQLLDGTPIDQLNINANISVTEIDYNKPLIPLFEKDSTAIFPPRSYGDDRKLSFGKSIKTHGKHYYIIAENFIAESDEIAEAVQSSIIIIIVTLIAIAVVLSIIMSRIILRPFNRTLEAMDAFNLKQEKPLAFAPVKTKEFNSLNHFLNNMTRKAVNDYISLKEFSENASHEIQTPLAVIRGKMELLMETDINEKQAEYISAIQNSVNKLSAVNHSLTLLTKLENQEYDHLEKTNISDLVNNSINAFQELISMKDLTLETDITENITTKINTFLADVMLNNLISNAVRHNIPKGNIRITLSSSRLVINNSGNAPGVATGELFKRFKKSNQSKDSTGLGLSIVKKICDLHGFNIQYFYSNSLHTVEIVF